MDLGSTNIRVGIQHGLVMYIRPTINYSIHDRLRRSCGCVRRLWQTYARAEARKVPDPTVIWWSIQMATPFVNIINASSAPHLIANDCSSGFPTQH